MKVYNYISMLLLVGTAIFVSCSQDEEMSGENMDSLQSFQISVLDGGFQDMDANKTVQLKVITLQSLLKEMQ